VKKVFPESEHRFCVRHLYSNFQEKFKGEVLKNQLWTCARSSSEDSWKRNMEKMKALDVGAYEWLSKMEPNTWVRAYFSTFPKCDILLNNNCEVFNKYILEARELPILSMFEKIKCQLMTRHFNKRKELENEISSYFCPKIRKKLARNTEFANVCYPMPSGAGVFQVLVRDYQHIVDLTAKTCDCRRWQLTGIPCCHAVSCLRHEKIPPESVLPSCYSLDAYNRAYANSIWPCKDKSQWEKMNGPEVLPPFYEKRAGRPPKARKKQAHEVPGRNGPRLSKHGVTMHCSHCSDGGHNKAGCRLKKMGFNSEEAKALVATTQATTQLEAQEEAMRAAADQVNENETPDALNISSTQPPSLVEMTQASSSVLSEMLGEVRFLLMYDMDIPLIFSN
jgi:hypothetical protein